MGENVSFASNGGTTGGYLATPEAGKGPGVIVVQEWWGLVGQIKGVADMLAGQGFNALVPDFYHGKVAPIGEPDKAAKLMMEMNIDQAAKDARGAAQYLAKHPATGSPKIGVVGFCMGGMLALLTGTVAPEQVGVVVDCYGVPPPKKPDYAAMKGTPVLVIFGENDGYREKALPALEKDLKAAGVPFETVIYPEADHAFLNDERPEVHRADHAEDAWGRIVPFLRKNLGG